MDDLQKGVEEQIGQTDVETTVPSTEDQSTETGAADQSTSSGEGQSKEVEGLLAAKKAETDKRQEVERERDYFMGLVGNSQPVQEQGQAEDSVGDDYLTKDQIEKQFGDRYNVLNQQIRHVTNQNSLSIARGKHDDFEEAYNYADTLCKEKPFMVNVLLNNDNVGEAIYDYGKTHPDYQKKQVKDVVEKIQKNLSRAPTLSDASGSSSADLDKANFYLNRSKEEHDLDVQKRLGLA